MSSRDAVVRRVAFWAALLAGAALVGSQFGCDRPQATPSSAGFPHAGRWPLQQEGPSASGTAAEVDRLNWWIPPGAPEKQLSPVSVQQAHRKGTLLAGSLGPLRNVLPPKEKAVPAVFVEPSE